MACQIDGPVPNRDADMSQASTSHPLEVTVRVESIPVIREPGLGFVLAKGSAECPLVNRSVGSRVVQRGSNPRLGQ